LYAKTHLYTHKKAPIGYRHLVSDSAKSYEILRHKTWEMTHTNYSNQQNLEKKF